MGIVEIVLATILAFLCIMCGVVIVYDCFVYGKSVNLISKKLGVIYALAFFLVAIIIFIGIVSAILDGGVTNVHW